VLVLTRRKNELIYIGENIKIMICEIRPGAVRVGLEVPPELGVSRDVPCVACNRCGSTNTRPVRRQRAVLCQECGCTTPALGAP
jgi:carbon storage regulator CsrA